MYLRLRVPYKFPIILDRSISSSSFSSFIGPSIDVSLKLPYKFPNTLDKWIC